MGVKWGGDQKTVQQIMEQRALPLVLECKAKRRRPTNRRRKGTLRLVEVPEREQETS